MLLNYLREDVCSQISVRYCIADLRESGRMQISGKSWRKLISGKVGESKCHGKPERQISVKIGRKLISGQAKEIRSQGKQEIADLKKRER